jgi:hypothetical protein
MRLLTAFALMLCGQITIAASKTELRPQDIQLAIQQRGAKSVAMELFENREKWPQLLKAVSSGSQEWLNVAKKLSAGTDAGATSMLQIAVTRALGNNPLETLKIMSDDTVNYSPVFSAVFVCSSNFLIDYPADESALEFIDSTVEKLKRIKEPTVANTRDQCITAFQEARFDTLRIMGEQK